MDKLKIAVQKSGRLLDDSLQLLRECGLKIETSNGALKSDVSNFPLEILFLINRGIYGHRRIRRRIKFRIRYNLWEMW